MPLFTLGVIIVIILAVIYKLLSNYLDKKFEEKSNIEKVNIEKENKI